jgi:hypothetical protein
VFKFLQRVQQIAIAKALQLMQHQQPLPALKLQHQQLEALSLRHGQKYLPQDYLLKKLRQKCSY